MLNDKRFLDTPLPKLLYSGPKLKCTYPIKPVPFGYFGLQAISDKCRKSSYVLRSKSLYESKRQMIKFVHVSFLFGLTLRILALSWVLLTCILYKMDRDADLDIQKRRTTDLEKKWTL